MKLYFAAFSTAPKMFADMGHKELLESYLYFKNKDLGEWLAKNNLKGCDLFLDSGAFTAFTKGTTIDIDEYVDFVKKNKHLIKVFANLDVIGDWKATKKNQEYIESRGVTPLATFHFMSPLSELEVMLNKYDYIALGGLVPYAKQRKKLQLWLDSCFNVILKHHKATGKLVKVHGFGVNAYWAWLRYPFYSVDATSWQASGRFAEEYIFKNGKPVRESSMLTNYKVNSKTYQERFKTSVDVLLRGQVFITELWRQRGYEFID